MPHFVEMPRLELFMHSGFPITRWPDGHEAWIWLTEKDDRVLAAALNVLGVATQRNGFPLFEMAFTYERPRPRARCWSWGAWRAWGRSCSRRRR